MERISINVLHVKVDINSTLISAIPLVLLTPTHQMTFVFNVMLVVMNVQDQVILIVLNVVSLIIRMEINVFQLVILINMQIQAEFANHVLMGAKNVLSHLFAKFAIPLMPIKMVSVKINVT